jgi:arsenate reductase (thioredoxin)
VAKKQVLFVCVGNACRSQMAEGFARVYGGDVIAAASAGLSPAMTLPPLTRAVMLEKNIPIDGQFPKGIEIWSGVKFDIVVNMSGYPLPSKIAPKWRLWNVADPIGMNDGIYRQVRDQIETLVMQLVLEVRTGAPPAPSQTNPHRI